jgi:hypothetical protein
MRPTRKISRRSFLGRVGGAIGGASLLGLAGCTTVRDHDSVDPGSGARGEGFPGTAGNWDRERECTDGDSGRQVDPPGRGRRCNNRRGRGPDRPRRRQ